MEFMNGLGTEISIGTLLVFLLYVLKREGIFRKIGIKINFGNGRGNPGSYERRQPTALRNSNSKPGMGKICDRNKAAIDGVATLANDLKSSHEKLALKLDLQCKSQIKAEANNRQDHKDMFNKIEEIWKSR